MENAAWIDLVNIKVESPVVYAVFSKCPNPLILAGIKYPVRLNSEGQPAVAVGEGKEATSENVRFLSVEFLERGDFYSKHRQETAWLHPNVRVTYPDESYQLTSATFIEQDLNACEFELIAEHGRKLFPVVEDRCSAVQGFAYEAKREEGDVRFVIMDKTRQVFEE